MRISIPLTAYALAVWLATALLAHAYARRPAPDRG